jgi:hypothetical protein
MDPMEEDKVDSADGAHPPAAAGKEDAASADKGVVKKEVGGDVSPPPPAAQNVPDDKAAGDVTEDAEKEDQEEEKEKALKQEEDGSDDKAEVAKDGDTAGEDAPADEDEGNSEGDEAKRKKRRSIARPAKKVLVAKKERELGITTLKDKRDLSEILPIHDCMFLAKNYWVFTHEQLRSFLGTLDAAASVDAMDEESSEKEKAREEFFSKLRTSGLLPSSGGATKKDVEPPSGKPSAEKTDEDVVMTEATGDAADETKAESASEPEGKAARVVLEAADSLQKTDGSVGGEAVPLKDEDCEKRLQDWKEALDTAANSSGIKMEDLFPLDGAIRVLFAPATLNFLGSIPVRKLYDFLALKKTETGAVCDMYAEWREVCGFPKIPSLAAAKYLLAVNARIETALSVVPSVAAKDRCWMIDPINVLTGAAREFLVVEEGLVTAASFVETRTKDLAAALVVWREKNGLVPLKGSGKVAMISGWKAAAKEAMEIEAAVGKVLTDFNFDGIPELGADILSTLPSAASIPADEPAPTRRRSSGTPSKPTVRPGPKPKGPKIELKVTTAPKVAPRPTRSSSDSRKSEEKTPNAAASGKKPTPKSKKRATSASRQADYDLHSKMFLDEVLGEKFTDTLSAANIHTAAQLFEANSKPGSVLSARLLEEEIVEDEDESEPLVAEWCKSLKEKLDVVRHSQPQTKSTDDGAPRAKRPKPEPKTPGSAAVRNASDPFELLSAITKQFLVTIGITTAEQFLSTRTTEIAAEFVQFRIKEGMPELKGLGSIASVSGWKANCRKYARSMGLDQLAEVEPVDKSSSKPEDDDDDAPHPGKRASSVGGRKPEVPFLGTQRRTVAVQSELGTGTVGDDLSDNSAEKTNSRKNVIDI